MSVDKALKVSTSAFTRHRSFGYETRKELCSDFQAFILDSQHHFKTTSRRKNNIKQSIWTELVCIKTFFSDQIAIPVIGERSDR